MSVINFIKGSLASTRFRSAAVLFASRSVNSVIALLFTLIAGRILTVEDHGIYTQILARIVIAQAIAEAGLQLSLVRYLAPAIQNNRRSELHAIFRASLQLKFYAFLALLILTLGAMFAATPSTFLNLILLNGSGITIEDPDAIFRIWLIFLGGFGMSLLSYLESILIAYEFFKRMAVWLPAVGLIRLGLLFLYIFGSDEVVRSEHVLHAFALGPYLAVGLFFFFFRSPLFYANTAPELWRPWVRKLAGYNVWILAASFMSILSDWMEIHMIQDSFERGLYSAARMPMQGFVILLATMQAIFLPRFSGLTNKAEFKTIFIKLYKYIGIFILLLLPGLLILAEFIPWWYGSRYESSVSLLFILYPNYILRLCFAPLGTALYALDQPRLIAIEAGLRMAAGFTFNFFFIPIWGVVGAALASLLAQFAGWGFLIYCYYSFFKRDRFPFQSASRV